ncbi:MAG: SH3 domain-containing protein [Spirochaetaceae bacterium]|jgi:hypothetical protein|nr:SH3 domain-containing protein [Spirochaetaceae bacterium]
MGKYVLFFSAIIGALLLPAGCSNKEPAETAAATADARAAAEEPEAPAAAGSGYPLRVGRWLYTFEAGKDTGAETDVLRAAEPLSLGEKLQLTAAETRKATDPYTKAVYDYYQVRRDTGTEGLVFANQTTVGSVLAVVSDERANLYRTPRNIDASDYILPRKTVLGVFPETERDGFIRMDAYDPVGEVYRRNLFIKTSAISYNDVDVQSSILLQTAETLDPDKERNRRQALLDSALYDYPESIFAEDILALAAPDSAVPARETDALFMVIDDDAHVRESPDASSPVVVRLEYAAELRAVEETSDEFDVGGRTARWYRITEPADGWVFGAWLEAIQ